jgi:peroxiredoxin
MAPIAVGDKIPDVTLSYLDDDNQSQKFNTHEELKEKKVVLIAVPGAFTPICSQKHIPSFINNAEEIKNKGVSDIIVISVNDPFVMKAWERSYEGAEHLKFVADGSRDFTKALGLELDLSEKGLGVRSHRYSLLVDDLVVKVANIEEGGAFSISGGEDILKALQ